MRPALAMLGATAFAVFLAYSPVIAAVTPDQFPPKTTGDLIALCSAQKDDPLMTAAVNFCQGFAEGVVEVALGYEAVTRKDRQPFCLPSPRPTHNQALAQFVAWAQADPARMADPPVVGVLHFLIQQYPCSRPTALPKAKKQ
ncbi:MAG TPA: Rap1a/Tai family immunity protein [Acetobacteraceae bacterium]|nr:Rap1a/Tai family immunity protein [Acetobacteraceae bacterium]